MSLKYRILWVDDHKDDFAKEEQALKRFIESLFFEPCIDFCEDIESAKNFIKTQKYDVVFSDFNVDEENGNDFIKFIRSESVNTEILFYSGQNQLPDGQLERVSFFFATGSHWEDKLLQKMKDLISLTIDKLNDLTNLRGIVMSEVSELDSLMEEIILTYYRDKTSDSDGWKEFQNHIIDKEQERILSKMQKGFINVEEEGVVIERKECIKNCTHIWKEKPINEIVSSIEFESSKKAHTIHIIAKTILPQKFILENYKKEIIEVRNNLAHSKSEIQNGKEVLVTKKSGEIVFTQEKFIEIRKNIKKYHELFSELQEKMNAQSQPNSNTGTNQ